MNAEIGNPSELNKDQHRSRSLSLSRMLAHANTHTRARACREALKKELLIQLCFPKYQGERERNEVRFRGGEEKDLWRSRRGCVVAPGQAIGAFPPSPPTDLCAIIELCRFARRSAHGFQKGRGKTDGRELTFLFLPILCVRRLRMCDLSYRNWICQISSVPVTPKYVTTFWRYCTKRYGPRISC